MLDLNRIYQGDCLEVMGGIDDQSIDLTVTSPPYDNLRDYNGYTFDFEGIAAELWRVTKQGGVVVWIVADATINGSETGTSFRQALGFMGLGFNLHDTMIWNKGGFTSPESNRYPPVFEYMFIFTKKGRHITFNGIIDRKNKKALDTPISKKPTKTMKNGKRERVTGIDYKPYNYFGIRFNVWDMTSEKSSKNRDHPCPFPEALARDHIISWSNPRDLILDPMCGSGTTCKMAAKLGRDYIGIDISEEYCQIARDRIAKELAQPTLPGIAPQKPKPEQMRLVNA